MTAGRGPRPAVALDRLGEAPRRRSSRCLAESETADSRWLSLTMAYSDVNEATHSVEAI